MEAPRVEMSFCLKARHVLNEDSDVEVHDYRWNNSTRAGQIANRANREALMKLSNRGKN